MLAFYSRWSFQLSFTDSPVPGTCARSTSPRPWLCKRASKSGYSRQMRPGSQAQSALSRPAESPVTLDHALSRRGLVDTAQRC